MMTKRKAIGTTERTTVGERKSSTLSALEDNVVRMRHGFTAPGSLVLENKARGNDELRAQLIAMERRALSAVGPKDSAEKRKIVSALQKKKR